MLCGTVANFTLVFISMFVAGVIVNIYKERQNKEEYSILENTNYYSCV